jgi:large subunit ribosomal protein L25
MQIEVNVVLREKQGTGASRRLRRSGKVPGILYGTKSEAQAIELDHNTLFHQLKLEAFHASILTMNLNGAKQQVLLRDVQMHPFRPLVLHVDFQRVAKDQKIHMKVPLHFINAEISPGVKMSGGIVSHVLTEVDISCFPQDLPEFIEVDLANLELGHSIHLSNLILPSGVECGSLIRGDDLVIATIQIPRGMATEEAEATAKAAETAEAAEAAAVAEKAKDQDKDKGKDKKEGDKK